MLKKVLEKFPASVFQSLHEAAGVYRIEKNLCAIVGELPEAMEKYCVATFEHEKICILKLPSMDVEIELPDREVSLIAVYRINHSDPFYVPTGRIFVRLRKKINMQEKAEALKDMQFRIIDIPKYAPYSGWVEHLSGKTDKALSEISQIKNLEDVENIEPQMLSVRSLKASLR